MTGTIDPGATGGGPATDNSGTSYTWETYPERLQRAGVTWRIYHEDDDFDDNNLKFFAQFRDVHRGDALYDNALVDLAPDAFARDAAAGTLPQVSWVIAPETLSEHPPFAPSLGEDFTARVVDAVLRSPAVWARTAIIVTYDENGGFFDHMSPPTPPSGTLDEFVNGYPIGLGFRVPTTVISPWTRRRQRSGTGAVGARVNSAVFDHTSILRLLESRFGVTAPLISSWRRATCANLADAFDFASFDPSVPALPDTSVRAAAYADGACAHLPDALAPNVQHSAPVQV